ncbi:MAG: hypothetical protein ACO22M_06560 [Candidatus Nanopelagicaceae bacterium]
MKHFEKISNQFELALNYLDLAESTLHGIREIELADHDSLNIKFVELVQMVEDLHYSVVAPMEMEDNEREAEIERLEKRLAELRAA